MDVDIDAVSNVQHYMSKVNDDYNDDPEQQGYGQEYKKGGEANLSSGCAWATKIQLDNESGLYYFTVYLPAKDIDNTRFETDLGYWLKGEAGASRVQVSNIGLDIKNYITSAKALAAAGNATFIEALPVVEALETYLTYADAYFGNKTVDTYKAFATIKADTPTKTDAPLEGVSFYGTSLLLEDQVTIRHYFKVSDLDAFKAAYKVEGMYGIKGNFIYFDIVDVSAQFMGDLKALTIKDDEGNTKFEVKYAVINYIASIANDANANLASLANAMYDYYLAAVDYAK